MRATRVRRLRPLVQLATFLLFLWLAFRPTQAGILPADLFFWADPLAGLFGMLAARTLLVPFLFGSLAALAGALLLGRAWCGWLCPLGTLLDWTRPPGSRARREDPTPNLRRIKYVLLTLIALSALLGSLTFLVLDPISLVYRTATMVAWPAFNALVFGAESSAYTVPFLRGLVDALEGNLRGSFLPASLPLYEQSVLILLILASVVALNSIRERFWCRYLCPLGALLGLVSKWALVRRIVGESCTECMRCSKACPMGTIDSARHFESDPGECTMCLECVPECSRLGQHFAARIQPAVWRPYDPSRRQFIASAGAALVLVGVLNSEPASAREGEYLLRPPGARTPGFLARCIRCGICLRVCPTSGLQPSLAEVGWAGLWTPVLVPRLGYCDFSCNVCGQNCPTGAIPRLPLEEKRLTVIGQAYIDRNRCIPWADGTNCIVCEEMCPVPDKAIVLDEADEIGSDGEMVRVKRPRVVRERCIGCGICENRCPLNGSAAIRVYVPTDLGTAG